MPTIDLKNAVRQIYQIVDQRAKRGERSPFFFIAGAGVSNPPIPLAREIEERCKKEANLYDDTKPPELKTSMDSYSYWMRKAYPTPDELKSFLHGLMEGKPISKANFRLAHLLLDGRLARTVFTPNFDDMLTRSLDIFGERPLVCDHPLTVDRMWIGSENIQIIHVHGSYRYYDCCNSGEEIADRSQDGSMSMMMDQTLRDHSPLVVGYSGWEGDIIMSSLKHRLSSARLAIQAFWFCYTRESFNALPAWLANSANVFFVLPEDHVLAVAGHNAAKPFKQKSQVLQNAASIVGTGDSFPDEKMPTLPANMVLDALVQRFQLPAPEVTKNPLSFYADYLKRLLGTSDPGGEPDTFYGFATVIDRVERARDSEAARQPDPLKGFRDAMSKADYRNAIKLAAEIDLESLTQEERAVLVFSLMDASTGLNDNSDGEIAGYEILVSAADLLAVSGSTDPRLRVLVAKALVNKGVTLGSLGRSEEEISVYDEVVRRFVDSKEPELRCQVAKALFNKGVRLGILDRKEEGIAVYDEVLSRFGDSKEPELREPVARALFNKGVTLGSLGRSEEEIAVYDEVGSRFVNSEEPELRVQVAKALFNKGVTLGSLHRIEEEIAVYDEVVSRFGDAREPLLREQVAKAFLCNGMTFESQGNKESAIESYGEVLARFGEDKWAEIEETVSEARNNRDNLLSEGEAPA